MRQGQVAGGYYVCLGVQALGKTQRGEVTRVMPVIGVEKCHPFATRQGDSTVARRGNTGIGLAHKTYAGISHARDQSGAIIGGAIVHHNDLKILEGLGQSRLKRVFNVRRLVV